MNICSSCVQVSNNANSRGNPDTLFSVIHVEHRNRPKHYSTFVLSLEREMSPHHLTEQTDSDPHGVRNTHVQIDKHRS